MAKIPLGEIWGVSSVSQAKLAAIGCGSVADVRDHDGKYVEAVKIRPVGRTFIDPKKRRWQIVPETDRRISGMPIVTLKP